MLSTTQRLIMAEDIISAMRDRYEQEGEEGDFDDGYRYFVHDASDGELEYEYSKWCK
jgi:hypothetical protein